MKKLLILLILSTFLLSGCGIYNLNNFVLPDDSEFLALIQELDTPQKICQYMKDNFTYEFHDSYTLNPYILWQFQKGDCNDLSIFATFIANYHGYETYQVKIYWQDIKIKHRLAVYREIKYSFSDNCLYFFPIYDNFLEIVNYDSFIQNKVWSKYIVYDYDMNIIEQVTSP